MKLRRWDYSELSSVDFIQFTSNYIMNKLNYSLSQLFNELQTFESILRQGKMKRMLPTGLLLTRPNLLRGRPLHRLGQDKPAHQRGRVL